MYLFGQQKPSAIDKPPPESLFEHVARQNGPLEDYHPQMLLQCLLWGRLMIVRFASSKQLYRKGRIGQRHHRKPCAGHLRRQGQGGLDVDAHRKLSAERNLPRIGKIMGGLIS
jgi:hypothetical protein